MTSFSDLPEVPGLSGYRYVGIIPMTEERYLQEGWVSTGSYEVQHPIHGKRTIHYWACDPEGMKGYAALREQRRQDRHNSWKARQDMEEEQSKWVETLVEEKSR